MSNCLVVLKTSCPDSTCIIKPDFLRSKKVVTDCKHISIKCAYMHKMYIIILQSCTNGLGTKVIIFNGNDPEPIPAGY